MEYQRVIAPIGHQLQRVHQFLAEFRPTDAVQIKLSQIRPHRGKAPCHASDSQANQV
jgi:hypothetical protein